MNTSWPQTVDTFLSDIHWQVSFSTAVYTLAQSTEIRFAQNMLADLRAELLQDSSKEHFALALGHRRVSPSGQEIIVVQELFFPNPEDIQSSALFHVRPTREFIRDALLYMQQEGFTALVDVHTHPFASDAHFSGTDTADEKAFCEFLSKQFGDAVAYGSIVIAQEEQQARLWRMEQIAQHFSARIRTQTAVEVPLREDHSSEVDAQSMQARSALALGVDAMRRITQDDLIVLAGVGGLGSVLAEQLVRSGFSRIGLIDDDVLELSNLNRFAGGFYADALAQRAKVHVVEEHLRRINPHVEIISVQQKVHHPEAIALMASAQWILVSTDTHSSRHIVQKTALKYAVPFISAGVNIAVSSKETEQGTQHHIEDQSGEVIFVRYGDAHCLHCLGRINFARMAAEEHPDIQVRRGLVQKGYVQGLDVKEPAVMPLNAIIASQAVHCLLTQYRTGGEHAPVVVYEAHTAEGGRMYVDTASLRNLPASCLSCGRFVEEDKESCAA